MYTWAKFIPYKKQPVDYHTPCVIYMETKRIYSKTGRYFKFSKKKKNTYFLYTFQKLIVMIRGVQNICLTRQPARPALDLPAPCGSLS